MLVECAERLIAEENVRLAGEGARNRHTLAHAPRERMRIVVLVSLEAEPREPGAAISSALLARYLVELEPERHVIERAAPWHQPVMLEDDADLAAKPLEVGERIVVLDSHAPGRRPQQTRDQVKGCRLAAAGLAEDRNELSARDGEGQVAHRLDRRAAVAALERLVDLLEGNLGRPLTANARRPRDSAVQILDEGNDPLHDQNEDDEHQRPGDGAGHVKELLLASAADSRPHRSRQPVPPPPRRARRCRE